MAKSRKVANTVADPTLGTAELEVRGKKFTLCFDMGALAEAELHFRRAGVEINILNTLPVPGLSTVLIMFPCAVHKFHPELSFEAAQALIRKDIRAIYAVNTLLALAWREAMPEPDENEKNDSPPTP